jgi:small subunit ribosomal protein S12
MTIIQMVTKRHLKNRQRQKRVYMLQSCPQRKATCLKVGFLAPKKPNSATRKIAKVTFTKSKRRTFCYIPGIKHTLQKFSTILLRGGRTKDLPGFRYKATRGVLDLKNVYNRFKARSKYGIKKLNK